MQRFGTKRGRESGREERERETEEQSRKLCFPSLTIRGMWKVEGRRLCCGKLYCIYMWIVLVLTAAVTAVADMQLQATSKEIFSLTA